MYSSAPFHLLKLRLLPIDSKWPPEHTYIWHTSLLTSLNSIESPIIVIVKDRASKFITMHICAWRVPLTAYNWKLINKIIMFWITFELNRRILPNFVCGHYSWLDIWIYKNYNFRTCGTRIFWFVLLARVHSTWSQHVHGIRQFLLCVIPHYRYITY